VKKIAESFNTSFNAFRADKEVVKVLSARERGWVEGKVEGRIAGANELAELIKSGLSVDEALRRINEAQYELAEAH